VGTLYDLQANALTIGAGLLQPPFFSPTSPLSLNYGGFGSLIGRDLIRPYDHQGRLYNVNGSTEPWWTVETDRQFRNGAQCFVDSYDSLAKQFPVAGGDGKMTYDARITLMEDMADVGGLGLAYRSWQRAYSSANVDQRFRLPGLPWTEEQLFFIAYAQNWCGLVKPPAPTKKEKTDKSVWIDPRSPPQLRVNGAVAQSEQFSKAFQCPSGRPMNPQKKCQTW
jgi:predicted metalloendopeptidase